LPIPKTNDCGNPHMTSAFIIMQIGNPELDNVCARAIVPAVEVCGLDAKRIDKHNTGGLLKGELLLSFKALTS
jgi:hypothetical protein